MRPHEVRELEQQQHQQQRGRRHQPAESLGARTSSGSHETRRESEVGRAASGQPEGELEERELDELHQNNARRRLSSRSSQSSSTSSKYISNLVYKSGALLDTLKQQYASYLTGATGARGDRASSSSERPDNMQSSGSSSLGRRAQSGDSGGAGQDKAAGANVATARGAAGRPGTCPADKLAPRPQPQAHTPASATSSPLKQIQRSITGDELLPSSRRQRAAQTTASEAKNRDSPPAEAMDQPGGGAALPQTPSKKPPLPPPPPRDLVRACVVMAADDLQPARRHALKEQSFERAAAPELNVVQSSSTFAAPAAQRHQHDKSSSGQGLLKHKRTSSIKTALKRAHLGPLRSSASRRAAREAASAIAAAASATSLELLGSSCSSHSGAAAGAVNKKSSSSSTTPKSMPYELFEPPVTQRTFERSKRRGAMASQQAARATGGGAPGGPAAASSADFAQRQMSVDTIGLRQLTDEYLENAGVKLPICNSGHHSLVALNAPTNTKPAAAKPGTIAIPGGSSTVAAVVAATSGSGGAGAGVRSDATNQAQCALEVQLYQAARQAVAKLAETQEQQQQPQKQHPTGVAASQSSTSAGQSGLRERQQRRLADSDPSSQVSFFPGNLPWQSDVSVQCELLQAPPAVEPYETTGDILNTIARPFRGPPLNNYSHTLSFESSSSHHHHHHHLSATLKRGLSAISQHHLSPSGMGGGSGGAGNAASSMAMNVVGNLKKSISNTFDVANGARHQQQLHQAAGQQHLQYSTISSALNLRSQDSLPAYSSLQNEPDDEPQPATTTTAGSTSEQHPQSGLIGQLASKLSRQSSKKFNVGKRGLQRALSFDCRGYKRLEAGALGAGPQQGGGAGSSSGRRQPNVNQTSADSTSSSLGSGMLPSGQQLLAARHRAHNKSTLALQSPRPYLPQSASQVDFQVPLLPYERMQEAIVSQRLLDPLPASQTAASEPLDHHQPASQQKLQTTAATADELMCAGGAATQLNQQRLQRQGRSLNHYHQRAALERHNSTQRHSGDSLESQQRELASQAAASEEKLRQDEQDGQWVCARNAVTPPRLVLNIPSAHKDHADQHGRQDGEADELELDECELVGANAADESSQAITVITCLPSSPNVILGDGLLGAGGQLSQSPSFCIDPDGSSGLQAGESHLLTASDVFNRSKNFIKRPSTMMAADEAQDAMNQVAQALDHATQTLSKQHPAPGALTPSGSVRRDRRQAIVPPKLATDACTSPESESRDPEVAALVDLSDDLGEPKGPPGGGGGGGRHQSRRKLGSSRPAAGDEFGAEEEAQLSTIRRKRSGGGIEKLNNSTATRRADRKADARAPASELPTFQVDDSAGLEDRQPAASRPQHFASSPARQRPDSQATNADSIVSSGSSNTLSHAFVSGRLSPFGVGGDGGQANACSSAASGALSPSGSASLSVPFGSGSARRRSSIAVIPQMQICPGDLLVYSKQLIDRMNQTDDNEPPQFLTIDGKKGKGNIWASFKLCAQFDNRSLRARNELLCSLEDVLASLQPSTFVDEQLSHYKGMLWNEFLYETESRRSASSDCPSGDDERLAEPEDKEAAATTEPKHRSYRDELIDVIQVRVDSPSRAAQAPSATGGSREQAASAPGPRRSGSIRADEMASTSAAAEAARIGFSSTLSAHESLKSSPTKAAPANGPAGSRGPFGSPFRPKPKLKRGQTVDSVFRIPLIPSSPLKHAQQHQQTPTAHLEDHNLNFIEDDERSSMGSANSGGAVLDSSKQPAAGPARRKRSSSARSRSNSRTAARAAHNELGASQLQAAAPASHKLGDAGDQTLAGACQAQSRSQDSSFDAEDARDLLEGPTSGGPRRRSPTGAGATPNQILRQSSLSTLSSTITRTEQKRQRALWDLFQSECAFFFDHLMTLKNVYMEPLKKIQVEGFAMFADPDVLFGNLDELCCDVYDFCKEFLYIIMRTLKTRPEELNATDVLIKLYKKNPKIDHLRAVYHRYTLNYINALTYLESLRRQVEFVEFEKWSSRDVRCKKLQLTDLLVAPVQHIMRVPIILKDIEAHTENPRDREEIRAILSVEEASLRELDDKMRWLKNFERLLEIQKNIQWPSVFDMELKLYVPEFLKEVLSKQPCEKLIVSPRRQIVHEGTLSNLDLGGKANDMHVILFDDMLLLTRRKKCLTKKSSTVCKTNSAGGHHASNSASMGCGGGSGAGGGGGGSGAAGTSSSLLKDDGSFKYVVYKQPLSLDRFYVHDVQQVDSQAIGLKHLFLLIVMNRFQQIINVHSFAAPNDDLKQTWLFKIKKTTERWKRNNNSSAGATQGAGGGSGSSAGPQQAVPSLQDQQQVPSARLANTDTPPRCIRTAAPAGQRTSVNLQSHHQALAAATNPNSVRPNAHQHPAPLTTPERTGGSQLKSTSGQQSQVLQPIEFVITSASESPGSEQFHKCR